MSQGIARFQFHLAQLNELLQSSTRERNPALWLYTNNARTVLFMLEGLSKLYENLHNKKKFDKLNEHFKALEDAIGSIDHYDALAKELLPLAEVPATVKDYMQAQSREKIQRLNDLLEEKKWVGKNATRIKKIEEKLQDAHWLEPLEEGNAIQSFYKKSIREINTFWAEAANHFTEMEIQVHEMRRELRWLSIYPQALQGMIQLHDNGNADESTDKYITPEIAGSPFNKMPERGENKTVLLLEKKYFLSLSWLIERLGEIKDKGLRLFAIAEALQQTEKITHDEAIQKAIGLLGGSPDMLQDILKEASDTCKAFFDEKHLDKLVVSTSA